MQEGVIRAQCHPIEATIGPSEAQGVVIDRGDLAMLPIGARECPGCTQRVEVRQPPVGAQTRFERFLVERQIANACFHVRRERRVPEAHLIGHDAALRAILGNVAVLSGQRIEREIVAAIILSVIPHIAAHRDAARWLQHDARSEHRRIDFQVRARLRQRRRGVPVIAIEQERIDRRARRRQIDAELPLAIHRREQRIVLLHLST